MPSHPLPPQLGTAFSTAYARRLGVSEKRLRGMDLGTPTVAFALRPPRRMRLSNRKANGSSVAPSI
ncbi:hypothetical protein QF046_000842 [Microbacterium sp. W4I4]|nr:hypothetical protein [Microbacterium sp. W4I4]